MTSICCNFYFARIIKFLVGGEGGQTLVIRVSFGMSDGIVVNWHERAAFQSVGVQAVDWQ